MWLKIKTQLKIRTQNVNINLYYTNICKYEHENNMTRIWCKIVFKTSVEETKKNERSHFYLYPFKDLTF